MIMEDEGTIRTIMHIFLINAVYSDKNILHKFCTYCIKTYEGDIASLSLEVNNLPNSD